MIAGPPSRDGPGEGAAAMHVILTIIAVQYLLKVLARLAEGD